MDPSLKTLSLLGLLAMIFSIIRVIYNRLNGLIKQQSVQNVQEPKRDQELNNLYMRRCWITENLPFFRQLGFFADAGAISNEELAAYIDIKISNEYGDNCICMPTNDWADQYLLDYDHRRVWWKDLEVDVCLENDIYISTLQEWAAIP